MFKACNYKKSFIFRYNQENMNHFPFRVLTVTLDKEVISHQSLLFKLLVQYNNSMYLIELFTHNIRLDLRHCQTERLLSYKVSL